MSNDRTANPGVVLDTDDIAARKVTVTGWVSRDGRFYGDDERIARWAGCTHKICECGKVMEKSYTKCTDCRDKADIARWEAMPLTEAGDGPFCLFRDDTYFWSLEEVYDHCYDNDIKASDLMLVLAEPCYAREIDEDYWSDDIPENGELPPDIAAALEALNAVIRQRKEPLCWYPSNKRVVLPDEVPS